MRQFLSGFVTATLVCGVGVAAVLFSLRAPSDSPPAYNAALKVVDAPTDLSDGEVWLSSVSLNAAQLNTVDGALTNIRGTGDGVRVKQDSVVASSISATATVSYEAVAGEVGPDASIAYAAPGQASLRRNVNVLGQTVSVTATGRVFAENGLIAIDPESVDVGAPGLVNDMLSAAARNTVKIRQAVPGLPKGTYLESISVNPDGFDVQVKGSDVELTAQQN